MDRQDRSGPLRTHAARKIAVTTLAGTLVTVTTLPEVSVAVRAPGAVDVLETAVTIIGLGVALLAWARYRIHRRFPELVLVVAVVMIATAYPAFDLVIRLAGQGFARQASWGLMVARLVAAALLALAGLMLAPSRLSRWCTLAVAHSRRATVLVVLGPVALTLAATELLVVISPASPKAGRLRAEGVHFGAAGLFDVVQLVTAAGFVIAAWQFARRADREGDRFLEWAAVACTLGFFSSLNYMIFPLLSSEWVYTRDAFRAAACVAWFVAGAHEIVAYQAVLGRLATLEERRRIARDLHDGTAQELAFIATQAKLLASDGDPRQRRRLAELAAASERALHESRRAISALARRVDQPLETELARTAKEVAHRSGTTVHVAVQQGLTVDSQHRETLERIVREAMNNATRHGHAKNVEVDLSRRGGSMRLHIADDGSGFDLAGGGGHNGFGLLSMRERAEASGGAFSLDSAPGRGTTIDVRWT